MEKKIIDKYLKYYIGQSCLVGWPPMPLGFGFVCSDPEMPPVRYLLLRPLSSITGNECFELYRIGYPNSIEETEVAVSGGKQMLIIEEQLEKNMWTPEQTIYLLNLGFDIFGLISDGLAVDRTTAMVKN